MSLEITYFAENRNDNIYGLPISSETRTASASHAESGATPSNAVIVRIKSTANNRYSYAVSPVATATAGAQGHYIASGDIIDLPAVAGNKVSVITAS